MKHIRLYNEWLSENKSANEFLFKQHMKKKAKERREEKHNRLAEIELSKEEQVEILKAVKAKKYDVLANMDKMEKLSSLGLVRKPKGVEVASSFSFPFYLTKKGEKAVDAH